MSGVSPLLTPAEMIVAAKLFGSSKSEKEMAAELGVTTKTISSHAAAIYRKLDLRWHPWPRLAGIFKFLAAHGIPPSATLPDGVNPTLVQFGDTTNRQRSGQSTRPSPVVGRAGDAQSQDGITAAAEPITTARGTTPTRVAAASGPTDAASPQHVGPPMAAGDLPGREQC